MNLKEFQSLAVFKNLNDSQVKGLFEGLSHADTYVASEDLFNPKMTYKEVKDETGRLRNALVKLRDKKGTQAAALKSIQNTSSCLTEAVVKQINMFFPDYYETVENIFETLISKILKTTYQRSDLDKLIVCLDVFHDELKEVGKGGAKRQASYYKLGIIKLAEQFESVLPHLKASSRPECLFLEYVGVWFEYRLNKPINYPHRHVKKALEERKAGNWEKIPLS